MTKNNGKHEMEAPKGRFLVYEAPDGQLKLDVRLEDETVWLTQQLMAELFGCSADNISLHLKNIYAEGELDVFSTAEDFSVVRKEGIREVKRTLTFYNLDVSWLKIWSVGVSGRPLNTVPLCRSGQSRNLGIPAFFGCPD